MSLGFIYQISRSTHHSSRITYQISSITNLRIRLWDGETSEEYKMRSTVLNFGVKGVIRRWCPPFTSSMRLVRSQQVSHEKQAVVSELDNRIGKVCRLRTGLSWWLVLTDDLVGTQSATRCHRPPPISASQSSSYLQGIVRLAFWAPSIIQAASCPYTLSPVGERHSLVPLCPRSPAVGVNRR